MLFKSAWSKTSQQRMRRSALNEETPDDSKYPSAGFPVQTGSATTIEYFDNESQLI